jgi:hypothetical protein
MCCLLCHSVIWTGLLNFYSCTPSVHQSILIPYSCTEFGRRRQDNVEVIFPESQVVGSGNPSSVADNTVLASASSASAAADSAALVDKAIAKLPADVRAHATGIWDL